MTLFPYFEDESEQQRMKQASEDLQEPTTPPTSPSVSKLHDIILASFSSGSSTKSTPGVRSLQEINEVTENLNDLIFFCLFADFEPLSFQEAIKSNKWQDETDKEIKAIIRNDTWEFTTLPKIHKTISVKGV